MNLLFRPFFVLGFAYPFISLKNYYFQIIRLALSTINTVHNHSNKPNDESKAINNEGKKLLVGSVKQVARWCRLLSFLEPTKIIYQVFGTF